jgi:CheY-like chemotaxis protein
MLSDSSPVLIVDDEKDIRDLLKLALMASGYQVATAANGVEALDQIQAVQPSAIVLDLMMPKMTGFEVVDTLREYGMLGMMPVIILTARDLDLPDRERLDGTRAIFHKGSMDVTTIVHEFSSVWAA